MLFITADKEGLKHTLCTFTLLAYWVRYCHDLLLEIVQFRVNLLVFVKACFLSLNFVLDLYLQTGGSARQIVLFGAAVSI